MEPIPPNTGAKEVTFAEEQEEYISQQYQESRTRCQFCEPVKEPVTA